PPRSTPFPYTTLFRSELGLMMVSLLVAWFALVRPRRIVFDVVAVFSLPVAYEVFRMGYYGEVVPNTALAKDAGGLHMSQGWAYRSEEHTSELQSLRHL